MFVGSISENCLESFIAKVKRKDCIDITAFESEILRETIFGLG